MQQIYPQQWLSLPKAIRNHLAVVFSIPRTGVTEVRDQEVVSDGYTAEDLKILSHKALCDWIGSEETFARAWEITLAKVHSELNPPIGIIKNVDGYPTIINIVEEKIKIEVEVDVESMKNVVVSVGDGEEKEVPKILFTHEEIPPKPEVPKPFCDKCSSKGVRHKNGCPNKTF